MEYRCEDGHTTAAQNRPSQSRIGLKTVFGFFVSGLVGEPGRLRLFEFGSGPLSIVCSSFRSEFQNLAVLARVSFTRKQRGVALT